MAGANWHELPLQTEDGHLSAWYRKAASTVSRPSRRRGWSPRIPDGPWLELGRARLGTEFGAALDNKLVDSQSLEVRKYLTFIGQNLARKCSVRSHIPSGQKYHQRSLCENGVVIPHASVAVVDVS